MIELYTSPDTWTVGATCYVEIRNSASEAAKTGTVTVKVGNTVLAQQSCSLPKTASMKKSVTLSFVPSTSWFVSSGNTNSKYIQLTVTGAFGSGYDTQEGWVSLYYGAGANPSIGTATATGVNSARVAAAFSSQIVSGLSRVKLAVPASSGTDRPISTVTMTAPGESAVTMSYNSSSGKYEGTTTGPVAGKTSIVVTATDQRGYTASKAVEINPVVYSQPYITIDVDNTYRCNSAGEAEIGGPYLRVKATCTYDTRSLSGNYLEKFRFYIKEDGSSTTYNLTSGTQSNPVQIQTRGSNESVTIVIVAQDHVSDEIKKEHLLPGAWKDLCVKRSLTGTFMGIGKSPPSYGGLYGFLSSVDLPEGGAYTINGIPIDSVIPIYELDGSSFGKDFLNVNYTTRSAKENRTAVFSVPVDRTGWTNYPSSLNASYAWQGIRIVYRVSAVQAIVLIFETYPYGRIWYHATTPFGVFTRWFGSNYGQPG